MRWSAENLNSRLAGPLIPRLRAAAAGRRAVARYRRSARTNQRDFASIAHGDHVGKGHAVKNVGHGVADFRHHQPNSAILYILAVAAWPVGSAARACDRRQRTVDRANYMADFNVACRAREHVTAARAFSAEYYARVTKITENCIEKFLWNVVGLGDFDSLRRLSRLECGERGERFEAVLAFGSEHFLTTWAASGSTYNL
jgi:hypothetical protein